MSETASKNVVSFEKLLTMEGFDLGFTEYRTITQEQINLFADATDDHQWLHTDVERATAGPFGAPIAHGYLTLSLAIPFWTELLDVEGVTSKVNYGLEKVRFISPVLVNSRIRMTGVIASVTEVKGGVQLGVDQTIEIEGGSKPAAIAHGLYRFYN